MDEHDSTGTPTARSTTTRPVDFLGWCFVAAAAHLVLLVGLSFVPGPDLPRPSERTFAGELEMPRDLDVARRPEDVEELREQDVVYEEAVMDEEADNDLPPQDYFGMDGLCDAPFEGPSCNGTISLGGGAGGAFAARRGGGGGRARALRGRGGGPGNLPPAGRGLRVHGGFVPFNTEGYDRVTDNPFLNAADEDISTFSIDVDTASYANVRRFLNTERMLPPKDAVRIEELVNYFPYDYEPPAQEADAPFRADVQIAGCPWAPRHRLARIALQGKVLDRSQCPSVNLVFLVDVSGSMDSPQKLGLVKQSLKRLVRTLRGRDRVALVVYAGAAGLVLPSTPGSSKAEILAALERLDAGGSTNGGAGIELAYKVAAENFIEGGVNRVILATDGDFNVGVSDRGGLTRLIEDRAKTGVFLSILGFGMGNYKDGQMEELSNRGNGNYAYIDSLREARKVLVEQASGTLVTIAKDVKVQIFFNPSRVAGYRLIGYENRLLAKQDFNDDTKDAGEIGAGHAVTALYEIVPVGAPMPRAKVDPNPFRKREVVRPERGASSKALFRLRLRYKRPDGDTSTLMEEDVVDRGAKGQPRDPEFRWAAAVAAFGMLLRESPHKGDATWSGVLDLATPAVGEDPGGYRVEFLDLVRRAEALARAEGH